MSNGEIYKSKREPYYKALREYIGGELGERTVLAIEELYALYDEDVIIWLSRLYDPESGGFYYSNSARDNEFVDFNGRRVPLGVDVESTCQALGMVSRAVQCGDVITPKSIFPDRVYSRVISFIKGLQHENGFFYHPQWDKEWIDSSTNRRARDLHWCTTFLRSVKERPYYDTPDGMVGEFQAKPNTETEKKVHTEIPRHLLSKESFLEYLSGFDMKNNSYHSGNEITTQTGIILERDRVLRADGADYSLMDILCDWMTAGLNPETGHWQTELNYYGVSGFLKAGSMFTDARRVMPYPEASAGSAIKAVLSDEPVKSITDIFNTWYLISEIIKNLRLFGGDGATERTEKITRRIMEQLPEMIIKTKEKLAVFKKCDGSFSYLPECSSPTSQGMPVAIRGTNEGDVNATGIAINGVRQKIFTSLGLERFTPPLFTMVEANIFVNLLDERRDSAI